MTVETTIPNLLISVLFIAPALYFACKKPVYAISIIVLGLPTFLLRWKIGILAFNTLDILIYGAVFFWFFTHKIEIFKFINKNSWLMHVLASISLIALAAFAVSPEKIAAAGIVKSYFIGPLLFLFMLITTLKKEKDLKKILISFSILTFVVSTVSILQIWFPKGLTFISDGFWGIPNPSWQGPDGFRATSFLQYPNAVGLLLAPIIPILIYAHTLLKNKYLIAFNIISIFTAITSIYLAKSKGALLALALTGILVLLYKLRKKIKYLLLILLAIIIVIPPSLDTLLTKIGPGSYSAQLRFIQWEETIELLNENPITGAGLSGFQTQIQKYHTVNFIEIFLYPHNIILNFWVELGLIGMLVFMTLILYSLIKSINILEKQKIYALTGIASMMIILIHGIVDVPYFKNDLAVVFWFLWSWPFLTHKERWLSG